MIITQKHIASKLGVTHATVSRSLKGDILIPVSTRNKVLKTAQEMGYRVNLLARGLKGMGTKTIGIIWSLDGPHEATLVPHTIAARMRDFDGYTSAVSERLPKTEEIDRCIVPSEYWQNEFKYTFLNLENFLARGIDAVVIQWGSGLRPSEQIIDLASRFSAAVFVTTRNIENLGFDQVIQDRGFAISETVAHFVKTGRRKPLMAMRSGYYNEEKINLFLKELARQNLDCEFSSRIIQIKKIENASFVEEFLAAFIAKLSRKTIDFDSLFCGNDESAIAAIKCLEEKGYKVPQDVAVVGLNNIPVCSILDIASIERNDALVAQKTADLLIRRIKNRDADFLNKVITMEFICRKSAG